MRSEVEKKLKEITQVPYWCRPELNFCKICGIYPKEYILAACSSGDEGCTHIYCPNCAGSLFQHGDSVGDNSNVPKSAYVFDIDIDKARKMWNELNPQEMTSPELLIRNRKIKALKDAKELVEILENDLVNGSLVKSELERAAKAREEKEKEFAKIEEEKAKKKKEDEDALAAANLLIAATVAGACC